MADANLSLTIRALGAGELDRLVPLHAACFEDAWDLEALATLLAMPGAFALLGETRPGGAIGFIMIRAVSDEAEIISFGIHPALRRRGFGRRLLNAALAAAADLGVRHVFLEVAADNSVARDLYLQEGFNKVGERPKYYHKADGDVSALVMTKDITIGSNGRD